jgi:hypothetical protein
LDNPGRRLYSPGQMTASQRHHIGQRVRVGAIGLAIVVVMIVLAGAILGAVSRERPITAAGGAKPDTVANMALANSGEGAEPLADMGVTPATINVAAAQ